MSLNDTPESYHFCRETIAASCVLVIIGLRNNTPPTPTNTKPTTPTTTCPPCEIAECYVSLHYLLVFIVQIIRYVFNKNFTKKYQKFFCL